MSSLWRKRASIISYTQAQLLRQGITTMVKIKICGLTDKNEAEYLNANQVEFAGMVLFYEKSRRNISIDKAKEIMSALAPGIKKVAVTVSPSLKEAECIEEAGFDYIQVHGELSQEIYNTLHIPVIKAFNVSDIKEYNNLKSDERIVGFVFDAAAPGSGKSFDWTLLSSLERDDKLWFLAGGLNPGNVAEAVKRVSPDVLDVSSGVENDSGMGKSPEKIKKFVDKARSVS